MGRNTKKYQGMYGQKQPYFAPDVESKPIPPPIGGWNAIDPLSAMDPKYAVILDNWVPRTGYVELRGGYNTWTQNIGGLVSPVESLMVYKPDNAAEKMFAASGSTIVDVSTNGIQTTVRTGLTSDRWQYINFTPAGSNNYLLLVNGSDPYTAFDGTTWTTPTLTGVAASTLISINIHKRRIWFTQANSTVAYYLATDAIQGPVTAFDIGAFMSKGGNIVGIATWTVDGGVGPDDLLVLLTSKGQAVVYKGTDPSNADAWSLVGVFDSALPIGRRCYLSLGSEVGVITTQGLLPLSQSLPFNPSGVRSVALTNKIQNAMLQAAQLSSANFGWELTNFTAQALIIMNVPQTQNVTQVQYVMNALTGAWCSFSGWNANTFAIFNESLYFGDNKGNVNLAYAGALDLVSPIVATMKCAFNYFDDPGRQKDMSMIRPLIVADGAITPTIAVDVDFGNNAIAAPVSILTPAGAVWDASTTLWDSALWSTGSTTVNNWLSVTGLGTALSVKMQVNVTSGFNGGSVAATSVFDTGVFDTMVFDGNGATVASGQGILTLQLNSFEALMEFGGPI